MDEEQIRAIVRDEVAKINQEAVHANTALVTQPGLDEKQIVQLAAEHVLALLARRVDTRAER